MDGTREKVQRFNSKYKGSTVWDCPILGCSINFDYDMLTFCCSSTQYDVRPVVQLGDGSGFSKEAYISAYMDVFEKNQEGTGACCGCKYLIKGRFRPVDYDELRINHVILNHFRGCNSKCVYCGQTETRTEIGYPVLEILRRLVREKLIIPGGGIDFGGGEPSMLPDLGKYLDFGYENKMRIFVNTSGLLFRAELLEGLRAGQIKLQISPDAGTAKTYKKVKQQNGFGQVWKNIKRYCEYGRNVSIKYIVFSYNSSKAEIDNFIELCKSSGVKNVVVSGEAVAALEGQREGVAWTFGEQECEACAYLMYRCLESQIACILSTGNFSSFNTEQILNRFFNIYLKKFIIKDGDKKDRIYIFGLGKNGKLLCDMCINYGVDIEGFCDNDVNKQKESYRGLKAILWMCLINQGM